MRFTSDEFIDEMEDERKRDEKMVSELERNHYILLFLFDLLQFFFQFLVMAENTQLQNTKQPTEG